jgi:hypothetical protein
VRNPQRLAEERSIAYHREIASLLPSRADILEAARARVRRWLDSGEVAHAYARAWRQILDGPVDDIRAALIDPGQTARDLRQVSPFAGSLDPRTRWRIHRAVRERLRGRPELER